MNNLHPSKFLLILCFCYLFNGPLATGQMNMDGQLLFGNEWINENQQYIKVKIEESGFYKLSFRQLIDKGVPLGNIQPAQLVLYWLGKKVPFINQLDHPNPEQRYIAFFGEKNTSQLDYYLYQDPDKELLNPYYSLFSDTSTYFLTWRETADHNGSTYTTIDNNYNSSMTSQAWYWGNERIVLSDEAIYKKYDGQNLIAFSDFDIGEGFASKFLNKHSVALALNPHLTDQQAKLSMHVFSNHREHELSITVDGVERVNKVVGPYRLEKINLSIDNSTLDNTLPIDIVGKVNSGDQYALAFIDLEYAKVFNIDGAGQFRFKLLPGQARNYTLNDFDLTGNKVLIYNLTTRTLLNPIIEDSQIKFQLPALQDTSEIVIVNEATGYKEVSHISTPKQLNKFETNDASYLIISHAGLFQKFENTNWVEAYADYRSSFQGGGHQVVVIDVNELYDAFGYGITNHPKAIHNFSQLMMNRWPNLQYVLLLGHGYNYEDLRKGIAGFNQSHYLPTYGIPGSDNLLFSPLGGITPNFAHGRIAADTPEDIKHYLDKVKIHEAGFDAGQTLEKQAWRKNVLHIVGGGRASEQESFNFYLSQMGDIISQNAYGGQMTTVRKESNEAVETSTSETVINAVNSGVSIKTYLGHGGVTNTDFGLDNPLLFDNSNRYPLIFSLGCLTGYLYDQQRSLSESFVLTPRRGGIGYIASGGFAYPFALERLSSKFYELLGDTYFDRGVGDILKAVRFEFREDRSLGIYSLLEQMSYHGDPAIKLHQFKGPDYVIDRSSVTISPKLISTQIDSFDLSFDIANLGFNQIDTFAIQIVRTLPNGQQLFLKDTISTNIGTTTLSYRLAVGEDGVEGENKIEILLDVDNQIRELPTSQAESNNNLTADNGQSGLQLFIQRSNLNLISPSNYALVDSMPMLTVSTFGFDATERDIEIELDMAPTFNSSALQRFNGNINGGLLQWQPSAPNKEDQVWYWRVRELSNTSSSDWQLHSFKIEHQTLRRGWHQSDFFQFQENNLQDIKVETDIQQFDFSNSTVDIIGEAIAFSDANDALSRYLYNNIRFFRAPAFWPNNSRVNLRHLAIALFDPLTGAVIQAPPKDEAGSFGAVNISTNPSNAFIFPVNEAAERDSIINFIENGIPDGTYCLVISFHRGDTSLGAENWAIDSLGNGTNLFQIFEQQGARLIRQLEQNSNLPYAFAFIKNQNALGEMLASSENEVASVNFAVPRKNLSGELKSNLIGPSSSWDSLSWTLKEPVGADEVAVLSVLGWNESRDLADTLVRQTSRYQLDLSTIDANQYPFLQLIYENTDSTDFTYNPLVSWEVQFEAFPELVLFKGNQFSFTTDTLTEGAPVQLKAAVANFGGNFQDSITIDFSLQANNNSTQRFTQRMPALLAGKTVDLEFEQSSTNILGTSSLIVDLNADRKIKEQSYTNNVGILEFTVARDREAPLLDVTFDGRHILHRELISSKPFIHISLRDENKFLRLSDSTTFRIWLNYPDGSQKEVAITDPEVLLFQVDEANGNEAKLEMNPTFTQEGYHKIVIRALDASGNLSSNAAYEKEFEIIPDSRLSNVLPYPNPFTSSCRFVYTLTGDQSPQDFKIQIFSVSGRLVKEILQEEFGPLKVGTHLSDYIWDGTDNYGDRLANGVYLYKVTARDETQETLKQLETAADSYFKNGLGKIVILR